MAGKRYILDNPNLKGGPVFGGLTHVQFFNL